MGRYVGMAGELVEEGQLDQAPAEAPAASTPAPARRRLLLAEAPAAPGRPARGLGAAGAGLLGLAVAAALIALIGRATPEGRISLERQAPAAAPAASAAPATAPNVATVAAPSPRPLPAGLALYFAPGGALAPSPAAPVEAWRPVARYGDDWLQLELAGYAAPVWARVDGLPGGPLDLGGLRDLRPPPTAAPAPPAPVVVERPVERVVDCTRDRAQFFARRDVAIAGTTIGTVEQWSCESQAQADQRADEEAARQIAARLVKGQTP